MTIWLYDINQAAGTAKRQTFTDESDVSDFVDKLVAKIRSMKTRREFIFPRDTVETKVLILRVHNNNADEAAADGLAALLAVAEKKASEKYGHLKEIQAGNLLQVFFDTDGTRFCLLAKVDLLQILDKKSLKYREGLPVDRFMMKACLVSLGENNAVGEILVCDSNSAIASYWYSEFLGLEAIRDDTYNTRTAFDSIEKLLTKRIKPQSLSDYRRMRSGVLGYLKNKDSVVYEELIKTVFETYEPDIATLDINALLSQLASLPEKSGFDTQFDVDKTPLNNKRAHSLALTNHLELTIKDDDAIAGTIKAVMKGAKKAVEIYTDAGYDYFKGLEKHDSVKG